MADNTVIEVSDLVTRFGHAVIHNGLNLSVRRGEILALAGGSGCGKSTLLREIIQLQRPASGQIRVLGQDVLDLDETKTQALRRRTGVMFQHGALFSALTVTENIGAPLREYTRLSATLIDEIAALKVALVGLPPESGAKYPSEISGGMRKRVALARAIALDPELVFLDEPTAGLDPESADGIDDLVLRLKELLGLTIIVVTHDLDTLWRVVDRVAVLGDGKVVGLGSMTELANDAHPAVREYFQGPRGRAARAQA
jgi:phospholipid/cholesterol/gamma-HCH transport system ATP-binding protein